MEKLIYKGYDLLNCSASVCAHLSRYAEYFHPKNEAVFYIELPRDNIIACKRGVSRQYFLRLARRFRLAYKVF